MYKFNKIYYAYLEPFIYKNIILISLISIKV